MAGKWEALLGGLVEGAGSLAGGWIGSTVMDLLSGGGASSDPGARQEESLNLALDKLPLFQRYGRYNAAGQYGPRAEMGAKRALGGGYKQGTAAGISSYLSNLDDANTVRNTSRVLGEQAFANAEIQSGRMRKVLGEAARTGGAPVAAIGQLQRAGGEGVADALNKVYSGNVAGSQAGATQAAGITGTALQGRLADVGSRYQQEVIPYMNQMIDPSQMIGSALGAGVGAANVDASKAADTAKVAYNPLSALGGLLGTEAADKSSMATFSDMLKMMFGDQGGGSNINLGFGDHTNTGGGTYWGNAAKMGRPAYQHLRKKYFGS